MKTEETGTESGINESGTTKDQIEELSEFANNTGQDFQPKKEGVGPDSQDKGQGGGGGQVSVAGLMLGPAFFKTFGALADGCGEHWRVSEETCGVLGLVWGPVLESLFPNSVESPWLEAIMVTGGVLANPFMTEVQIRRSGKVVELRRGEKDGDKPESKSA